MFRSSQRRQGITAAIFGLWRNWALSIGALTVLTMLAPVAPRMWLAPINIIIYVALQWLRKYFKRGNVPVCSRLNHQASIVILISAVYFAILTIYSLIEHESVHYEFSGQPFTTDSPVISILILAPVACLVTLFFMFRRGEPEACRRCAIRYGNVIEHGFVGDLFRREWRYQTQMLFFLALALSVADWWYYLHHYVNTNLNRADMFFFVWMPLVAYVMSLVYLGIRYYSLWIYYCQNDEGHIVERPGDTTLRYLLISGDSLFLGLNPTASRPTEGEAEIRRLDTPVVVKTQYHESENPVEAISSFKQASGIADAEIRFAYESPDLITFRNIFHYFAFVDDMEVVRQSKLTGEWAVWSDVVQMASEGMLDRDLVSEIKRIYDVAMAWKTYDSHGRRLYPIKHYKPTFRLRDLRSWDVNFNDYKWLYIAGHNEDKFGFRFRNFFRNSK